MTSQGVPLYDLTPGKLIGGRYRIVQPHRQGGLSVAFEVTDETTGERRELQLFAANLFDRAGQAEEVQSMLAPWTEVNSDAVARVVDVAVVGKAAVALISEYPHGEPLRARLKDEGPLPQGEVVNIGRQLLEGLEAVHAAGLVHGDIKPSTLHVEGRGRDARVTLVDGGVTPALWTAKHLGDKTALIGTPYYAPIEQFGGDSPSVQSDLYNVAAVLFECLTGVLPWPGTSFVEVFQAKLDKRPPSMRQRAPEIEVDPELERVVVTGCLAVRDERHPSAQAFLRELEALADL